MMYIKFLKAGISGIDYGVPYEVVGIGDGFLTGYLLVTDEWGRPYLDQIWNLFLTFVFCDEKGNDLCLK